MVFHVTTLSSRDAWPPWSLHPLIKYYGQLPGLLLHKLVHIQIEKVPLHYDGCVKEYRACKPPARNLS